MNSSVGNKSVKVTFCYIFEESVSKFVLICFPGEFSKRMEKIFLLPLKVNNTLGFIQKKFWVVSFCVKCQKSIECVYISCLLHFNKSSVGSLYLSMALNGFEQPRSMKIMFRYHFRSATKMRLSPKKLWKPNGIYYVALTKTSIITLKR